MGHNNNHDQGIQSQASANNLPPVAPGQAQSHSGAENQIRSAKYTMNSKSPKNKVGSLQLLLRGKSQNRNDSRG